MTPQGFPFLNMAANTQTITVEEIDLLSFLRQNVARKLEIEAVKQGRPKTHPRVVQAVVHYFNLGPAPNQTFDHLVWRIAHGQLVSSVVLKSLHTNQRNRNFLKSPRAP